MRRISVLTEKQYTVYIQRGVLRNLATLLAPYQDRKIFVLSDETVWSLYGKELLEAGSNLLFYPHIIPPGESSKSLRTYGEVLEQMAAAGLHRRDLLLAFGGGVVGDLGGFAAATYLRGIDFIQIPTTLLAAVDSSVGGKTAINLNRGKNLAGAFHQPIAVYIDPRFFPTLPPLIWQDGVAEMIKTGVLFDEDLFHRMARGFSPSDADAEALVATCIQHKADIVAEDEKDTGRRQLLNLGHTFGHAVEAHSGYTIRHGQGVAMGMAMIVRAGVSRGFGTKKLVKEIEASLENNRLPLQSPYAAEALLPYVGRDKKARGDKIHLVIAEKIGQARILEVPIEEIKNWLEASL